VDLYLTVEEMHLLYIYDTGVRSTTIDEINTAMPYFDDQDLYDIAESVVDKLRKMNDYEFDELDIYTDL